MDKYGLIGEKLGHSFSAIIHNKLFGYDYFLKEIPKDEVDDFMRRKDFDAINVTIPYKQTVIPYIDVIDETAESIGAVNTIVNKDGKLFGYNTDFYGMKALINRLGIEIEGKKVVILGSGGTSKTAKAVAKSLGAKSIYKASLFDEEGCISYDELKTSHTDADILINTTPCGMYPNIGESVVDVNDFPNLSGVVDAVYNPLKTKLVYEAQKRGIPAGGGLYMLVTQAAVAAEKFVNKTVSVKKIDEIFNELWNQKENIVLVGMPGSGKTTVGKILSQKLSKSFVDTDDLITEQDGRTPDEIIKIDGEKVFRDIESDVIRKISAQQGLIIATGGGAVLRQENIDILKENGRIVFLDRPIDNILPTADRPLSSNRESLEQRYRERYGIYSSCCDIHINCPEGAEKTALLIEKEL